MRNVAQRISRVAGLLACLTCPAAAGENGDWSTDLAARYVSSTNLTYATASGVALQLDVYSPRRVTSPSPTVIHFHGGGWVEGTRSDELIDLVPFLARGFTVVNADYRLASTAPAPAAVEDARCVLKFVVRNAERFGFDTSRLVVSGTSAGGHLALLTGFLRHEDGFDTTCPTDPATRWTSAEEPPMKVAAVVNWYGVTDVVDVTTGGNARHWALEWMGTRPDRAARAEAVSPVRLVREDGPAVVTIHGDKDGTVPFAQAQALHERLRAAKVPERLVTVDGGHGAFRPARLKQAWTEVFDFLGSRGLLPAAR